MRRATGIVAIALVAAACGGGGGGSDQSPSPSPSTSSSGPPASCTDLSSGPAFTLVQQHTAFHPKCAEVKSEQSVSIENKDSILHNFTIPGTQVDVDIQPGTTFNGDSPGLAPGTYPFFCKFHKSSGMVGTLVVS